MNLKFFRFLGIQSSLRIRTILVLKIFIILATTTQAQEIPSSRDSLLQFINSYQQRDSIRVEALIEIQNFYLLDDHTKGRAFIEEAINISQEIDYKAGLGSSLSTLGGYYTRQGELDSALINTMKSIEILEELKDGDRLISAYNNLAIIYGQTGRTEQAISSYLEIIELLEDKPLSTKNVVVYYNLATAYQLVDDNEKYVKWIREVITSSNELNFTFGIIQGSLGLASHEFNQQNYRRTIEIADDILREIKRSGQKIQQSEARAYALKAGAFEQLGNFDEAIRNKTRSIGIYEEINSTQSVLYAYEELSSLYQANQDFENALKSMMTAITIKDSIFTAEQQVLIDELQTKYETEKIEREKESAELENLKLRNKNHRAQLLLFGSFGFVIILGITGFAFYRNQELKKNAELARLELSTKEKQLNTEKEKRKAELKAVRAQLNPHFIFNMMNSIQNLNMQGEQDKANEALHSVSTIMRKTLTHSEQEKIPLRDELELVELYLDAEKIRFEDRLNYSITIDDEIEPKFIQIIPMLLQPFVENSVKHGIAHKKEGGTIHINIGLKEEHVLRIEILDDGVGRSKSSVINAKNYKGNGYSIRANKERLANIATETGLDASIDIIDLEHGSGTKVIISYPISGAFIDA